MRLSWLAILSAAVGCGSADAINLDISSTLNARTNGLVLHEGGFTGLAAMPDNGQSCAFDANEGVIIRDFDIAGGSERVVDVDGTVVAAVSPAGVHTVTGNGDGALQTHALAGVVDARLVAGGFAALVDDGSCRLDFVDGSGASVALEACAPTGIAADRASGTVFLADGADVVAVDRQGARSLGVQADHVAWDADLGLLYAANASGVGAFDARGGMQWFSNVDGRVHALHGMGQLGAVAAMVVNPNGTGNVAFFDGSTGNVRSQGRIPSVADMTVSDDGGRLALVLDDTTHFYAVSEGPRQVNFDVDIPEPQVSTD